MAISKLSISELFKPKDNEKEKLSVCVKVGTVKLDNGGSVTVVDQLPVDDSDPRFHVRKNTGNELFRRNNK